MVVFYLAPVGSTLKHGVNSYGTSHLRPSFHAALSRMAELQDDHMPLSQPLGDSRPSSMSALSKTT